MSKRRTTPLPRLPEALSEYEARDAARFHMPGHKGRGMGGFWRAGLVAWDVTELSCTDDLNKPEGVLRRAQADCARAFGAAESFFLVNGATAGIQAMLLALPEGSRVLLARDCHRSVLGGAALAGHGVAFVSPAYDAEYGMCGMVTAQALDAALCDFPADAVLVTSPNYYGLCADIPALAATAHRHGALLLVDAAHGAHFPFGRRLPPSPAGHADLWVNSAHKTLNALGQAAILHRGRECAIPAWRVQRALTLVQTSSPSYLLTASLDWARYSAESLQDWDAHAAHCRRLAAEIRRLPGLRVPGRDCVGRAGIAHQDPTRLVIDVTERGITGFTAKQTLEQYNVFVEMADTRRLVCICTPSDDRKWYSMLLGALQAMPYGRETPAPQPMPGALPERVMLLRDAALGAVEQVPLMQAVGRVAAQAAGIYPPGIALWTPGERIREAEVTLLCEQQALGCTLFGVQDDRVCVCEG